ncbi:MAG: flagellar basal body rod protein FlgB [Desulfovibrionaceae bacterium]|nr:flagellar basal body rod protein FlgB [Desulfovibrionaceae bacterium]
MKGIVNSTQAFTEGILNLYTQRQNIVQSNIANVDTPSYRAKDLRFEEALQEKLNLDAKGHISATHPSHFPSRLSLDGFHPTIEQDSELRTLWGLDSVNLEEEMTKLTKINLKYAALTQVVKSGYTGLQQVIQEVR